MTDQKRASELQVGDRIEFIDSSYHEVLEVDLVDEPARRVFTRHHAGWLVWKPDDLVNMKRKG